MATRNFDLYACQTGTRVTGGTPTQIVGPLALAINELDDGPRSLSDGLAGTAARDKGLFSADWELTCQDISTLMTQLALWEAAATGERAILAEAREVGALTSTKVLVKRAMLAHFGVVLRDGGAYSEVRYGGPISCADDSDTPDDEIAYTEAQTKTATIGAGKRQHRILSAVHDGTGQLQATACVGLTLEGRGDVQRASGDGRFGYVAAVGPMRVTGSVTIQDQDVSSLRTVAQHLTRNGVGPLILTLLLQGSASQIVLTVANVEFHGIQGQWRAGQFAQMQVGFEAQFIGGTDVYALASGTHKLITVA